EHGANIVVHSTTKFLGGHGVAIGGMIVDGGNFDWGSGRFPGFTEPDPSYDGLIHWDAFQAFPPMGDANIAFAMKARLQLMRDTGNCPSPQNSFLTLLGVETAHLRMQRHCENAMKTAQYLSAHDKVNWVNYPGLSDHPQHEVAKRYLDGGFGALLGFGVKGGLEAGRTFIESLKLFSHLANIGDAKSLAIHPATTTHSQLNPEEQQASGVTEDYVRLSLGIEDFKDIEADLEQALAQA
ncbi:MAG: PLP-dependent transferase, partial [Verrucomicrobiota bacterium]